MANAAVLKTADRKVLQVRILCPPLRRSALATRVAARFVTFLALIHQPRPARLHVLRGDLRGDVAERLNAAVC